MDPANALDENRRLRRTMRDLVALSILPAVWTGLGPDGIARSLADALLNTLSLDFIYVRLTAHAGEEAAEVVRSKGSAAAQASTVREALAPLLNADQTESPATIPDPFGNGTLHVAVTRFGVSVDDGILVTGSCNPDFPTEPDRLLLGVAATQTAVVAQRRRAEEQVHEQREWLRVTLASIGDAVIATDTEGRVTFLNSVAEELTGWTQGDAEGQPLEAVFAILNEQTRQPVQNPVETVLREGVLVGLANHTVLVARDGTERPIDDSAAPIRDATGKLIGVVLTFRDVTEQRRNELGLRQSEARKSAILETALDCIITMDHEGKMVEFNPAAENAFGYRREQVLGRPLADFIIPPSLRQRHRDGLAHYLATGEGPVLGKRLELPALRADGTEFPAEVAITRISTDGPPVFTAYLRDLTQQKLAEQRRQVRLAVTHALSDAPSVDDGASGVLRVVCENLRWDVGFFWVFDEPKEALVCRRSWRRPDVSVEEFESASYGRTFRVGEGLPGRVWASSKPAWIPDIAKDPNFPRLAYAVRCGLHSAFACPIVVDDHLIGVIEFFTNRIQDADADLLETMGTVAGYLAQFIKRKTAEEELRQSERELADFFDNATIGLHWVGADGTILRANKAELEMLGYSQEEYVGRPIADFHADEQVICDILKRLQAGEKLHEYPARLRCKDGSIRDVLIDSSVLWKDGRFIHTRCFTRDVSERRRADAALRQSEQRFRQLADAMPQIVWTARPDGHIDFLNRRWTEFTGLPATAGNEAWGPVMHPDEAQLANERWAASVHSGAPFEMEMRLLDRQQQAYRWHLVRTIAARDESGTIIRWFGTSTDIHEQKRAEEASRYLAEASAALASVVDYESTLQKVVNLAVPYFADWSAVDVAENSKLQRLAVAHQDATKVEFARSLMREYPPDPEAPLGPLFVIRSGRPELVSDITDELLVRSAKDERNLELLRSLGLRSYMCVPLIVSGETLGALTFVTAESERRYSESDLALAVDLAHRAGVAIENTRLYQALRETDRRKDEFLATLAHELRNPLAPIRNSLQILKMPRVDAETAERSREMMERQVHHLVRLVDDLLDVSRVMRSKIELRRERIELAAVIARAIETVQPHLDAQRHQLQVSLPTESLPIEVDPVRLAQVVGNLLTNAAKYTEPNGRISLTAERDGHSVVLRIADNGIGIAAEMLPRIFELFVQVDHASTKAQGGLGIGLTLVKNLVEMHHGTVEARSEGLGKGSEFIVRLPISARHGDQNPGPGPGEQVDHACSSSGYRVLVVDDNQDAANTLAMLLKLQGHEVRVAYSGASALEITDAYTPDIVFLDIGMPAMDGFEVARRLRQRSGLQRTVLAALTGWGQQEDRRRTAEAGFNHHLTKPVDPRILETLLASRP